MAKIQNPITAALGHIIVAPASSLAIGLPVPGPRAPATPSATPLSPGGIHVTGFSLDPATVKLAAPIIEDSLLGAIIMAQSVVTKMKKAGKTDPDFLLYFKNATYHDLVLCEYACLTDSLI